MFARYRQVCRPGSVTYRRGCGDSRSICTEQLFVLFGFQVLLVLRRSVIEYRQNFLELFRLCDVCECDITLDAISKCVSVSMLEYWVTKGPVRTAITPELM
jgi:hypothetical protein